MISNPIYPAGILSYVKVMVNLFLFLNFVLNVKQAVSKPLHNSYLSLGSNLGNKFKNLQTAINAIFKEVGMVVKISSVYQTPAMGFEGDDFLNCTVQVQTSLDPPKILGALLAIEKKMGRERSLSGAYTSRPIDIDILFIDDTILQSNHLTVPHPEIQFRKFVLLPLAEINPNLQHPVLQKNVLKLLAETKDESTLVKQSRWLRNPKMDYDLSAFNYIAIEGNIGAGKTSLARLIANDFNAKLILERFKDNPFLPKFYKDVQRYAFPLEMSFLASRYQQLLEDSTQFDLFKECTVSDYDMYKSLIFSKITLSGEEYELYKKLFHLMYRELPRPDVYVYLYQHTSTLLDNIQKRGRTYERDIEKGYLERINAGYLEFIRSQHAENIKIIDITERDFLKDRVHYLSILKEILA